MEMKFETFDPRPTAEAAAHNEAIFAGAPNGVLGVEVTIQALAARCTLGNIDPQHSGGNAELATIEAASSAVPGFGWKDATLGTIRADLDSLGAMAVLALRAEGRILIDSDQRLNAIAVADKFARGPWPGPQPLPSRENPWPAAAASAESVRELAAIAAAVADHTVPLAQRVEWMKNWLLTGAEPAFIEVTSGESAGWPRTDYRAQVEREREQMIAALESGEIKYAAFQQTVSGPQTTTGSPTNDAAILDELCGVSNVALVVSTHRAATMIGYCLAPVVIAVNPAFRVGGSEPHLKFTVCQFQPGYVNLTEMAVELSGADFVELPQSDGSVRRSGWGGSPAIIGSPQGAASKHNIHKVLQVLTDWQKGAQ